MKNVIRILLVMVAVLAIVAVPVQAKKNASGKAKIHFTETSYNFGNIRENGGAVSHEFEFVNQGDGNLVIVDATAECGCTRPTYPKNAVAPGKRGKVKVTFNPAGRRGSFDKQVTIKTNGDPRKARVRIKGCVVPD